MEAAASERRTFASSDQVLAAVILGNDAVVSARPSTAAQLANACTAAGFDLVVPPTWGDEIVAMTYLDQLAGRDEHVVVGCACPRVAALLARTATHMPTVSLAAPPVAIARALRRIHGDAILITYVGDCPSSADASIDVRFSPHALFAQLERQGVAITDQSTEFDQRYADRWRRYASVPGGLPALRFLGRAPVERVLRTLDSASLENRSLPPSRANVLIDLAGAARCACACEGDRDTIEDDELPRSTVPVLRPPNDLVMGPDPTPARTRAVSLRGPARPITAVPAAAPGAPVAVSGATQPVAEAPAAAPIAPAPTASAPDASPGRAIEPPLVARAKAAAGRAARRGVLLAIPAVVLASAAALGFIVYRGGAVATTTGVDAPASPGSDSSATGGSAAVSDPAPPPPQLALPGVVVAPPTPARPTVPADSDAAPSASAPRAAPRRVRRPAPPVVPGWLPQGQPAFSPIDSARRRPDSSRNRPPTDTTRPPA